jgi:hypothetical protein
MKYNLRVHAQHIFEFNPEFQHKNMEISKKINKLDGVLKRLIEIVCVSMFTRYL